MTIEISSQAPIDISTVYIKYNSLVIPAEQIKTKEAHFSKDETKVTLTISALKLSPEISHEIEVFHIHNQQLYSKKYLSPQCPNMSNRSVLTKAIYKSLNRDTPLNMLEHTRKQQDFREYILLSRPDWYFSQHWEGRNTLSIKMLSLLDQLGLHSVQESKDWRFSRAKSLESISLYLDHIENYWSEPHHRRIFEQVYEEQNLPLEIEVASFFYGTDQVRRALQRHQKDWVSDAQLNNFDKNLNLVKSYCQTIEEESSIEQKAAMR